MSESMAPKQAQSSLEKQIEMLGNLRNAGTRAQEFREWRQATLTLIERMWPDQATRAQRFRRIPFSPASAKADDRVAREAFERGCAEARRLLRLWLTEVSVHGVTQEPEAPRLTEAVRAALVELQPKPRETARPKGARKKKAPLREMLGFGDVLAQPPEEETVTPAATRPAPPAPARAKPPAPPARESGRGKASTPAKAAPPEPLARETFEDALALSIDHAIERARHEKKSADEEPATAASPRTHEPLTDPNLKSRPMVSYVARAFIGLAADLEELGVPEGHRDRVRLALLDLAHHLDCGSVTWQLMRDAVTLVMHYPSLGRQAMPLLLPYLESAA